MILRAVSNFFFPYIVYMYGHVHTRTHTHTHRVWEKLKEAMQAAGASVTGFKRMIADWAKGKGLQGNRNIQNTKVI